MSNKEKLWACLEKRKLFLRVGLAKPFGFSLVFVHIHSLVYYGKTL
jgi:hypothetical protein